MFKNRVRTAALAGAIAVATGVSGLSVPAYAQDTTNGTTHQTDNNLNTPDASDNRGGAAQNPADAVPAKGEVRAEKNLEDRNDAIQLWITKHVNDGEVFYDYPDAVQAAKPEIENLKDAKAKEADATAQLNKASQVLRDAQATLDKANAEAKAAQDAWAAYAKSVSLTDAQAKQIQKLVKDEGEKGHDVAGALNMALTTSDDKSAAFDIKNLKGVSVEPNDPTYFEKVEESRKQVAELRTAVAKASQDAAANNSEGVASGLAAVNAKLNEFLVGNPTQLRDAAIAKTGEAKKYDVNRLGRILNRSMAQVRQLRLLQAYYGVAARYYDLYENNTLTNDERTTLRQAYENVLGGYDLEGAKKFTASGDFFKYVERELKKTPDGTRDTDAEIAKSHDWEQDVNKLRRLDLKYREDAAQSAAAKAAAEAERKAREEYNQKVLEALQALANANKAQNSTGNTQTPGQDTQKPGSGSTQKPAKDDQGLKIFGIIAGVIAAIAALVGLSNLPQVQALLKR